MSGPGYREYRTHSEQDFYSILGVERTAGPAVLKQAFRRLAQLYHPDRCGNTAEANTRFRVILEAWETLRDVESRRAYDLWLQSSRVWRARGQQQACAGGFLPGMSHQILGSDLNTVFWEIQDILEAPGFFSQRRLYSGYTLLMWMEKLLHFIDRWVLEAAGLQDYFFSARNLDKNHMQSLTGGLGHRPYVSLRDYFYTLRRRLDQLLNRLEQIPALDTVFSGEVSLLDGIFEALRYAHHVLTGINRVLEGDTDALSPFRFSRDCFRE